MNNDLNTACHTEAELEWFGDPEMFERPSKVASTEGKAPKTNRKSHVNNKVWNMK